MFKRKKDIDILKEINKGRVNEPPKNRVGLVMTYLLIGRLLHKIFPLSFTSILLLMVGLLTVIYAFIHWNKKQSMTFKYEAIFMFGLGICFLLGGLLLVAESYHFAYLNVLIFRIGEMRILSTVGIIAVISMIILYIGIFKAGSKEQKETFKSGLYLIIGLLLFSIVMYIYFRFN